MIHTIVAIYPTLVLIHMSRGKKTQLTIPHTLVLVADTVMMCI